MLDYIITYISDLLIIFMAKIKKVDNVRSLFPELSSIEVINLGSPTYVPLNNVIFSCETCKGIRKEGLTGLNNWYNAKMPKHLSSSYVEGVVQGDNGDNILKVLKGDTSELNDSAIIYNKEINGYVCQHCNESIFGED